jgi:hypothetical protein
LIGVISKSEQRGVVEEFFELFKTPWEFYRPGHRYDVVIATADNVPDVDTTLLLDYGPAFKNTDMRNALSGRVSRDGACVTFRDALLPIYGALRTFDPGETAVPCLMAGSGTAAVRVEVAPLRVIRIGYDIFAEVEFLLSRGQPLVQARVPTLDLHIVMLREWILGAGISFLEIPPVPAGHRCSVCLTHDIDFIGIRQHRFDHTMWGFLFRSTIGSMVQLATRKVSIARVLRMWRAAVSLPFVYLGWARDFWKPFDWYLQAEHGLPATYYLIPFRDRQGDKVTGRHAARRASKYDVSDIAEWTATLTNAGCELGVHGIDAWHDADRGREELARIASLTGQSGAGIRMHWLLWDRNSASLLDGAGYTYDSTIGYNETIGYRSGTTQVFRPAGARTLLELPLHIQDGALFYPHRLALSEAEAGQQCRRLIDLTRTLGGVLTVLWHDRSHGPERFWGEFYIGLLRELRSAGAWFGTAAQVVGWFRKRRAVRFGVFDETDPASISLSYDGDEIQPPLVVRFHGSPVAGTTDSDGAAGASVDVPWNGKTAIQLDTMCKRSGEPMSPVILGAV